MPLSFTLRLMKTGIERELNMLTQTKTYRGVSSEEAFKICQEARHRGWLNTIENSPCGLTYNVIVEEVYSEREAWLEQCLLCAIHIIIGMAIVVIISVLIYKPLGKYFDQDNGDYRKHNVEAMQ